MIRVIASPIRPTLEHLFKAARKDLLIATPYVKLAEAEWARSLLLSRERDSDFHLTILSSIRTASVLDGSLDIAALTLFSGMNDGVRIVNLPRLHAKVYIADSETALITSANLTAGGMEGNFEYGALIEDSSVVRQVRSDMQAYAEIGATLQRSILAELQTIAVGIANAQVQKAQSLGREMESLFNATLRKAEYEFIAAQVGTRSANGLFSEAILFSLRTRRLTTAEIHAKVQSLLPDLCDDSEELIINGEHFGKRWKHAVRNAQQHLKRIGRISLSDDGFWGRGDYDYM